MLRLRFPGDTSANHSKSDFKAPLGTMVYCHTCHKSTVVDATKALHAGWPKCCTYTMSLDFPKPPDTIPGLTGGRK